MNGYIGFYRGQRKEVYAETLYKAQLELARQFKAKKSWEVNVSLAEKDGKPVSHDGAELPGA